MHQYYQGYVLGAITNVKTNDGLSSSFSIIIESHQGFALSSLIFVIVMDEMTIYVQTEVSRCILFVDNIVVLLETKSNLNEKLELWRHILEPCGFRLNKSKTRVYEMLF